MAAVVRINPTVMTASDLYFHDYDKRQGMDDLHFSISLLYSCALALEARRTEGTSEVTLQYITVPDDVSLFSCCTPGCPIR